MSFMDAVLLFMDALLLFIDALMRVLGVVYGCVRCCIFHHGQCTFILFVDLAMVVADASLLVMLSCYFWQR